MELEGKVKRIGEIQTFASGFQKREMIILTQEQYPQPINVEFISDKVDLLNNLKEGESVKVGINIRGREWVNPNGATQYFNSIVGWRIEKIIETKQPSNENPFAPDTDDDLPF